MVSPPGLNRSMDDENFLTRNKPKNPNRVAAGKAVAERKSRGSKEVKAKAQETIRVRTH